MWSLVEFRTPPIRDREQPSEEKDGVPGEETEWREETTRVGEGTESYGSYLDTIGLKRGLEV